MISTGMFHGAKKSWQAFLVGLPVFPRGDSLNARDISVLDLECQNFEAWIVGKHAFPEGNMRESRISSCKINSLEEIPRMALAGKTGTHTIKTVKAT
jgi:hypothetical protein